LWVIFALLDPDPLTRLNPDPIRIRNTGQNNISRLTEIVAVTRTRKFALLIQKKKSEEKEFEKKCG
jgi:hypothetical protein